MRDRVFVNSSSTSLAHKHYYTVQTGWAYNNNGSYTSYDEYHAMRDEVIANYYKRSKQGEIFINPMYSVLRRRQEVHHHLYYNFKTSYYGGGHGAHYRLPSVLIPIPQLYSSENLSDIWPYLQANVINSQTYDATILAAWADVSVNEAELLASIGELPETVRWGISLMTRMVRTVRFFKSKRARMRALKGLSAGELTDALSDLWLEFRYAVRPLVFEMHQVVTAMQSEISKGSRQTARGNEQVSSYNTYTGSIVQGAPSTVSYQYAVHTETKYRAGVLFDIEDDINGLLALWGLDTPLEAIWELTPFSFIIDWFFSVGDVIGGWSVNASLRPLGSWITVDHRVTIAAKFTHFTVGNSVNISEITLFTPGSLTDVVVLRARIPHPDRPILPSFNLKLNTAKLIDLATIGRGLYRGLCS